MKKCDPDRLDSIFLFQARFWETWPEILESGPVMGNRARDFRIGSDSEKSSVEFWNQVRFWKIESEILESNSILENQARNFRIGFDFGKWGQTF